MCYMHVQHVDWLHDAGAWRRMSVNQETQTTAAIKAKSLQTHIRLLLVCREHHCSILNICYQLSPRISETLLRFLLMWVNVKVEVGQYPVALSCVCVFAARARRRLFMGHQHANSLMGAADHRTMGTALHLQACDGISIARVTILTENVGLFWS